jgi:hypothetical protein
MSILFALGAFLVLLYRHRRRVDEPPPREAGSSGAPEAGRDDFDDDVDDDFDEDELDEADEADSDPGGEGSDAAARSRPGTPNDPG